MKPQSKLSLAAAAVLASLSSCFMSDEIDTETEKLTFQLARSQSAESAVTSMQYLASGEQIGLYCITSHSSILDSVSLTLWDSEKNCTSLLKRSNLKGSGASPLIDSISIESVGTYTLKAVSHTSEIGYISDTVTALITVGKKPAFNARKDTVLYYAAGAKPALTADVKDSSGCTYQWYKNGTAVTGASGKTFAFTSFGPADTGTYRCIASNLFGSDSSGKTTLRFSANRPPLWKNSVPFTSAEGDTFSVDLSTLCTDPEGDALLYSIVKDSTLKASLTGTILSKVLTYSDSGTHTITLKASDGIGASETTISVKAANKNRKPLWKLTDNSYTIPAIKELTPLIFRFDTLAADPDGDKIRFELSDAPAGLSIVNGSVQYTAPASSKGYYSFVIKAYDSSVYDSAKFFFEVTNDNRAPSWKAGIDTLRVTAGTPLTIDLSALCSDPDGDKISYVLDTVSWDSASAAGSQLTLNPGKTDKGFRLITIIASDPAGKTARISLPVKITALNAAPIWSADADKPFTLPKNSTKEFSLTGLASDPENDAVSYSIKAGSWSGAAVTGSTLKVTASAADTGAHAVTLIASDGNLTAEKAVVIQVTNTNTAPSVDGQNPLSCAEDGSVTLKESDLKISDIDGDKQFTLTAAAGSNYSVNGLVITPAANFYGDITVPVTVSDGKASSAAYPVKITVTPVNDAPVVGALKGGSVQVGRSFSEALSISDIDGGAVTVSVLEPAGAAVSFDQASKTVTFSADRARYSANQLLNMKLSVSDGTNAVSVNWTLNTIPHVWDTLGVLDAKMQLFTALNSSTVYLYNSADIVAQYSISGKQGLLKSSYTVGTGNAASQLGFINDSITIISSKPGYQSPSSTIVMTCKNSEFPSAVKSRNGDATGALYDFAWCEGMTGAAVVKTNPNTGNYLEDPHGNQIIAVEGQGADIKASRQGTMFCVLSSPYIYRKVGVNGTWTKVKEPNASFQVPLKQIETASPEGDITYFIDNNSDLLRTRDGRTGLNLETVKGGTTSDVKSTDICAVSGSVLWRIAGDGYVQFTNNGFVNEYPESFARGTIKDIVLAQDGVTLFAIGNDGTIYRY